MNNIEDIIFAISIGIAVANFLFNTDRVLKAIAVCKESLVLLNNEALGKENPFRKLFGQVIYLTMFGAYCYMSDYTNAINYGVKLLATHRERGEKVLEGDLAILVAKICERQYKYAQAKELYETAIKIKRETGDRTKEAYVREKLATMFGSLGERVKEKEQLEKALAIRIATGDRKGEANAREKLATMFRSLDKRVKEKAHLEKALAIRIEIGDREGEAADYGNLGNMLQHLGEYIKAKEYLEKGLAVCVEIGHRQGESSFYGSLGILSDSLGEYTKAIEYAEKELAIAIEIGCRKGEGSSYGKLGAIYKRLGEYDKAKEYLQKALAIRIEIGDRKGEAADYGNLGTVFICLGEYDKAKEYCAKALAIRVETGPREGEAADYGDLGTVFLLLGEYSKAKEYFQKALAVSTEIGYRAGEVTWYGSLGTVLHSLGECVEAIKYCEKALAIATEIGDRNGQASSYGSLGNIFRSLGEYGKAKEYLQKGLAIITSIGYKEGEATVCGNLGLVHLSLLEYDKAEKYLEKALSVSKGIGDIEKEFICHCNLSMVKLFQEKTEEAFLHLIQSIRKCEDLRDFLQDNERFKISFSDQHTFPYIVLNAMFCNRGMSREALYVEELGRARALADLMKTNYSVDKQLSDIPYIFSLVGIENDVMKKESNCSCLYISHYAKDVFLWVLKASGFDFRKTKVNNIVDDAEAKNLNEFIADSFRSFGVLPEKDCEDRSLENSEQKRKSYPGESPAALQEMKDDDNKKETPEPALILSLYFKMIIAPVAKLLVEPEIVFVPDPSLFKVPFPALRDESGKFLSETFRIRVVPSLMTLKLSQDSPADYHSQTGALIVGDPDVGSVCYKGGITNIYRLPSAGKEAAMIGRLLGVQPLLGKQATKQAVLQRINSVSLIHFAAHGNAERGEIALAPVETAFGIPLDTPNRIPQEEDYLLTMSDISQIQLRAKLVVLSCCHSARGQVRAEGVVGIARAFLGSGARSVLAALWAIEDSATEQFMSRFYEDLASGESASESLHQAMKWMRGNGFAKISEWAPFMLIGDDVTFDFGNKRSEEGSKQTLGKQ